MSQESVTSAVRLKAINLRRTRMFGSGSLKVYSVTPDGEELLGTFAKDWFGHRVLATTDVGSKQVDASAWQFQVNADAQWKTTQAFMKRVSVVKIGEESWKVTKVEKPVGNSLVWKLKAQSV